MPFSHTLQPFTRASVEALNLNQTGVYGLFKGNVCIYVGKGDIRARLLAHLNGDNPCISRQAPTHWVGELWSNPDAREISLIVELNPVCNQRVG